MKNVKKNKLCDIEFKTGIRFEFFYALSILTDSTSKHHQQWKEKSKNRLPRKFYENFEKLGSSALLWPIFSVLTPTLPPVCSYKELVQSVKEIDLSLFQKKIFDGFIHDESQVKKFLDEKLKLKELISQSKNEKREWLIHIGLYPYSESSRLVQSLEFLFLNPAKFRTMLIENMDLFWKHCFQNTWNLVSNSLQKSMENLKKEFYENKNLSCLFEATNVRAIYNESAKKIIALRGGYSVNIKDIKKCYFVPSAFNTLGWWSALEDSDGKHIVFFPYFDPTVNVDLAIVSPKVNFERELDPFLIFKSLGDPTRFAIIKIISDKPNSASIIASQLGLSKATVSHHVAQLRQSGLLIENYFEGQILLSVNQITLEKISTITIKFLKLEKQFQENSYGQSL